MRGKTIALCVIALVVAQTVVSDDLYCPKASCQHRASKEEGCIEASKPKDSKVNIITLKRCYRKDRCQYNIDDVFKTDYTFPDDKPVKIGICERKEKRRAGSVFPGESCTSSEECRKGDFPSVCANNLCTGLSLDQDCKNDDSCLVGHYCDDNGTKKTCKAQKKINEKCVVSTECENHLACDGNKCVELFSVKAETSVGSDFNANACQSGYTQNSICIELKNKVKTDNGVQYCKTPGQRECSYTYKERDVDQEKLLNCMCSFSGDGGICPFSNDTQNMERISKWRQIMKAGSKCHTLNRHSCEDYDKTSDWIDAKSQANPQLFGSDSECAPNVVSSSSYLVLSISMLIGLLFL